MKKINTKRRSQNYSTVNLVPLEYYPYLIDMNNIYAKADSSVILGREKEIRRICNCFLKSKNASTVLLGEHGVGKTVIVQKLVDNVIKKKVPKELIRYHFIYLGVESIIVSLEDKKFAKKLDKMIKFLIGYTNLVIVIEQVHLVQLDYRVSYYFNLLLKQPHVKILGLSTHEEFYQYFEFNKRSRARLEVIPVLEPRADKIYPMICNIVKRLEEYHKVKISEDIIRYIISVSAAFYSEISNPELTINIIEKSMIVARRKHQDTVTKKIVNSNFNFDYELYKKMSKEDKEITAYHEAGHFVVQKMSNNIKNYRTTAITIVPSEDFLGVTLFAFEPEKQTSLNIDYYIDNIAMDLAGRMAEKIYFNSDKRYTSGARSDLNMATETARQIITEFGMIDGCGENMAYLGNQDMTSLFLLSETIRNKIDEATKDLISKSEKRAEEILNQNRNLLDRVAHELIKKEVLDEEDLNRICSEVTN